MDRQRVRVDFARNLRRAAGATRVSFVDIAARTHIPVATLQAYLEGSAAPTVATLAVLGHELGVEPWRLLAGKIDDSSATHKTH